MDMPLEEAQAYHDAYIGELPLLLERLRRRVDRTGGPELDGSLESLGGLGAWFVDQLAKDEPDGLVGHPRWWVPRPPRPSPYADNRRLTDGQLRLVDEVGAYLATVLQQHLPQAQWIVFRDDPRRRNAAQNSTMLRYGTGHVLDPVGLAYGQALHACLHDDPRPDGFTVLADHCLRKATGGVGEG